MIVHRKNQLPVFCLKLGSVVELAESDPCEKMPFSMLSHLWAVNGKPFDIISCFFRLWNAHYLFPMSICCEQKGRIPHPHQVKFIAIPRGKPSPWEEHVESSSVQWALLQFCVGEGTLRRERLLFLHINGKDGSQISSVEIVWMRKKPNLSESFYPNTSVEGENSHGCTYSFDQMLGELEFRHSFSTFVVFWWVLCHFGGLVGKMNTLKTNKYIV